MLFISRVTSPLSREQKGKGMVPLGHGVEIRSAVNSLQVRGHVASCYCCEMYSWLLFPFGPICSQPILGVVGSMLVLEWSKAMCGNCHCV